MIPYRYGIPWWEWCIRKWEPGWSPGRNISTTEKSPSVIITVRTGVVPSAAQTEPMRASSAMGATTCTAAVGRLMGFTAGVGVAQLFTAAEECLRVAFAAVQDHVLAA